jgi:hypothetical protein
LGSRRFATAALVAWIGLISVWVLPFAITGLPESQLLQVVRTEWFFVAVYAALVVNTFFCMLPRVRRLTASVGLPRLQDLSTLDERDAIDVTAAFSLDEAAARLGATGWRVVVADDGTTLAAVRRRFSGLGTILLHLILIVLVGAALLVGAPRSGRALVTEGRTFGGTAKEYLDEGGQLGSGGALPPVTFHLDSVGTTFWEDVLFFEDLRADIEYPMPGGGRGATVRLADPVFFAPTVFMVLEGSYYAPGYTLTDRDGVVVDRAIAALRSFPPGTKDRIEFPATAGAAADPAGPRYAVDVAVYPDVVAGGDSTELRSFRTAEPKFAVEVVRLEGGGKGRQVGRHVVRLGEPVPVGENTLRFVVLRDAGLFRITDASGLPWILGAIVVGSLAAVWRPLFARQDCALAFAGTGEPSERCRVWARCDFDREAGKRIALRIAGRLGLAGAPEPPSAASTEHRPARDDEGRST